MIEKLEATIEQLTGDEPRTITVYIPDFFEEDEDQRFPVLYMFDGQNVFDDDEASFGKSWGMSKFLDSNPLPLIIVGMECNHHDEQDECGGRLSEYSPFTFEDSEYGHIDGRGDLTMRWIIDELKPFIDENFPTIPDRQYTFIAGSSMGGLMSLYALLNYNEVFSRAAALSPSLDFSYHDIKQLIRESDISEDSVLYMDYGSEEFSYPMNMVSIYATITSMLIRKGVNLESRIVPNGDHSEGSWEKQIPFFINTLFYGLE